ADRQDETVFTDHDPIASALGSEDRGSEGVFRNLGAQKHHRVERRFEIEAHVFGLRLQVLGKSPAGRFGHMVGKKCRWESSFAENGLSYAIAASRTRPCARSSRKDRGLRIEFSNLRRCTPRGAGFSLVFAVSAAHARNPPGVHSMPTLNTDD